MSARDRSHLNERRLVTASLALVVYDARTLVLRRRPDERSFAHRWCLPGGRIEPGESPDEAAIREAAEETGLTVELHASLGPRVISVDDRPIDFEIHRFVARAEHDRVLLSEEHVEARWLTRFEAARAHEL